MRKDETGAMSPSICFSVTLAVAVLACIWKLVPMEVLLVCSV